jgi:coproporphyrinogen III oxidase
MSMTVNKQLIEESFKTLQDSICASLSTIDGKVFTEDKWERPGGGGGRTRVLLGSIIEKGGVNFSAVEGPTPQKILEALKLDESEFYATGVSIVLHPENPNIPIIHMNVRYFEMTDGTWWFGGGIDLTPHFVVKEDGQFFHQQLKKVCDKFGEDLYTNYKKWADDYFYIPHRKETRGIGGIFFDRLNDKNTSMNKDELFNFVLAVGNCFAPTYIDLIKKNKDKESSLEQKEWQYLRRGRYAEFNLVYDKGTKFGLETDGRTESILMSMPPTAKWEYNHKQTTVEDETLNLLKKGIDWV